MEKRAGISQGLRYKILRRDNFTCRYCGRSSPDVILHLDHVHPHSKGGADTEENLVTACQDCNGGKGARAGVKPPKSSALVKPAFDDPGSLVGLFGHTYDDEGQRRWQFHVSKQIGSRYGLQLFSWVDGRKTDLVFYTEDELMAMNPKFYATEAEWVGKASDPEVWRRMGR